MLPHYNITKFALQILTFSGRPTSISIHACTHVHKCFFLLLLICLLQVFKRQQGTLKENQGDNR